MKGLFRLVSDKCGPAYHAFLKMLGKNIVLLAIKNYKRSNKMNKKVAFSSVSLSILLVGAIGISAKADNISKAEKIGEFYLINNAMVPGTGDCFADKHSGDYYQLNDCHYRQTTVNYTVENKENKTTIVISNTPVPPTSKPNLPTEVIPTKELLTPVPNPTKEKECKNKNSGKDGTPLECNAGIGQEKK